MDEKDPNEEIPSELLNALNEVFEQLAKLKQMKVSPQSLEFLEKALDGLEQIETSIASKLSPEVQQHVQQFKKQLDNNEPAADFIATMKAAGIKVPDNILDDE